MALRLSHQDETGRPAYWSRLTRCGYGLASFGIKVSPPVGLMRRPKPVM